MSEYLLSLVIYASILCINGRGCTCEHR